MAWVIKAESSGRGIRIHIPREVLDLVKWDKVGHVVIDVSLYDRIVIRRFRERDRGKSKDIPNPFDPDRRAGRDHPDGD